MDCVESDSPWRVSFFSAELQSHPCSFARVFVRLAYTKTDSCCFFSGVDKETNNGGLMGSHKLRYVELHLE